MTSSLSLNCVYKAFDKFLSLVITGLRETTVKPKAGSPAKAVLLLLDCDLL